MKKSVVALTVAAVAAQAHTKNCKQASYKQATYFDLVDFLRLIHLTRPPFVFFSSTKSEFVRYVDAMIEDKWDNWQTFQDYERIVVNTSTSYSGKYEDNMIFKL